MRYPQDARTALMRPLVLLIASFFACATNSISPRHALLTNGAAWLSLCAYASWRAGGRFSWDARPSQKLAWAAGGLLAVAQVCERAVDGRGIWWAKAILPLLIHTLAQCAVVEDVHNVYGLPSSLEKAARTDPNTSPTTLLIMTASGLLATHSSQSSITVVALGLCYALLQSTALGVAEKALQAAETTVQNSASGSLAQTSQPAGQERVMALVRDVAAAATIATSAASLSLESWTFGGLAYDGVLGQAMGEHWLFGQGLLTMCFTITSLLAHVAMFGALLLTVERHGAFLTSFVPLFAALGLQTLVSFSFSRLWSAATCASSAYLVLHDHIASSTASTTRMRTARLLTLIAFASFALLSLYYLRHSLETASSTPILPGPKSDLIITTPVNYTAPVQLDNDHIHPIEQLYRDAQASWSAKVQSQSQSLEAAVAQYKQRYAIPPPPHFDKWYAFAKRKGVQMVDEYDTIYHSLLPFWSLPPAIIRGRAKEAIGYGDNYLMGLMIRDGKSSNVEGGPDWLQQAAVGMLEEFVQYLPDMDLAFNTHDEPRVVVPHDELSRMVRKALTESMPAALANTAPRNGFSPRPEDLSAGKRVPEAKTTRFNTFAHQPTWIPSRLSCSPDSPARALDESLAHDNLSAYALGDIGFIYNQTAFSDVCNSPSLSYSHGFFDRPNAFSVVHDLFPIFSQSKMSSFQDILFPSPWYWYGKVSYKENKDMDWKDKINTLWWRGSTTGGFSRAGGWKRQHRQRFVRKVNALDTAKVLSHGATAGSTDQDAKARWISKDVPRQDYKGLIDVHFSHIGQCDASDCDAQRQFFTVVDPADQQDAWQYKYLLDVDGNAFSGRFYAFLLSHSLTFKMAVFREWHEDWIKPWLHYVPLSLRGDEALEAVRFFDAEEEGRRLAVRVAENGRDWAKKALRNEDFEVWFFRLLLEYGRVIDDDRAIIGYSGL